MSYIGRYERFIEALKDQKITGIYEKHHIVPRSMGGDNSPENIIKLTPRQHYLAHWMLWKAYRGKMSNAFWFMNNCNRYKLRSRGYEQLRKDANQTGENSNWYGKKHTAEAKQKQSLARKKQMANAEVRENLKRHRANQVIPKEAYVRQSVVISSLVWLNDGVRSYRVRPELVESKLASGLSRGRLINYIDNSFIQKRKEIASSQWLAVKSTGHTGILIKV